MNCHLFRFDGLGTREMDFINIVDLFTVAGLKKLKQPVCYFHDSFLSCSSSSQ